MENELQNLFDFNRDRKMLRELEAEALADHRFSGVYLDKVSQLLYLTEQRLALWRIDETSFSSMTDVYSCLRCLFREREILREMAGNAEIFSERDGTRNFRKAAMPVVNLTGMAIL